MEAHDIAAVGTADTSTRRIHALSIHNSSISWNDTKVVVKRVTRYEKGPWQEGRRPNCVRFVQ